MSNPMSIYALHQRYHPEIAEHMLEQLFDTPTSDLVDELLHHAGEEMTDEWAKRIQEDLQIKELYKND